MTREEALESTVESAKKYIASLEVRIAELEAKNNHQSTLIDNSFREIESLYAETIELQSPKSCPKCNTPLQTV